MLRYDLSLRYDEEFLEEPFWKWSVKQRRAWIEPEWVTIEGSDHVRFTFGHPRRLFVGWVGLMFMQMVESTATGG